MRNRGRRRRLVPVVVACLLLAPVTQHYVEANVESFTINGPAGPRTSDDAPIASLDISEVSTTGADDRANITFGHVFIQGDVPAGTGLVASDDRGTSVPLQVDEKATHPDGSLRHAVITAAWDSSNTTGSLTLRRGVSSDGAPVELAPLLARDFDAQVSATIGATTYSSSARELLESGVITTWLSGPLVTEFHVDGPLRTDAGQAHSHLTARYNVRVYEGQQSARVDVIVENTPLKFGGGSLDVTYDLSIAVGTETIAAQDGLTHYHNSRFRQTTWWGSETSADVAHDSGYLIESRAVPNYDQSLDIGEAGIVADVDRYANGVGRETQLERDAIMGSGMITEYMPGTGGRADLAPLPRWTARYLLSMDARAKAVTLGTGNQAGSFRIHTRHPVTDRPLTAEDEPGATTHSNFRGRDNYIGCATCISVYDDAARYTTADTAHQPSMAYVPYLVTGDHYYLEEMQFWAGINSFATDPANRQREKGLLDWQQVRAQAWSLRKLARVAYITPDDDPTKEVWNRQLDHNIDRYTARYIDGPETNSLGVIPATIYDGGTGIAPWQNDYLTWSFGHLVELGYSRAEPVRRWLAQFPTQRMIGDGFCWILGSQYSLVVRDAPGGTIFATPADVYDASTGADVRNQPCAGGAMGAALGLRSGEMVGYSSSPQGYPAIMQAALASAVDGRIGGAPEAWALFESRTVTANYGEDGPEFAIIPRNDTPRGPQLAPATRLSLAT